MMGTPAGARGVRINAQDIAKAGIGYVPQGRGLFAGMSVRDNLALGRMTRLNPELGGVCWDEAKILDYFPRLKERMDTDADYLSGGEQQMVAVARALSGNVKLLLLDEPLAGMGVAEAESMVQLLLRLKPSHAMMLVEHDIDAIFTLADQLTVMVNGTVIASGLPATVRADAGVQAAYLGEDH